MRPIRTFNGNGRNPERGTAFVEFALVGSVLFMLMLGIIPIGVNLGNMVHVSHVARDIGNMYSRGVEFDQPAAQAMAASLAGTNVTDPNSLGVITLTRVRMAYQEDCDDAGLGSCGNVGYPVITQRIVMGDASLRPSDFGTPNMASLSAAGNGSAAEYLTDPSFRAQNVASEFTRSGYTPMKGESVFLVEYFVKPSTFGFLGWTNDSGVYARAAF